jgi:hypothetical protein
LKESKNLTKKPNINDQLFKNQSKLMNKYEQMEKLQFLIEQEGFEIEQLIGAIKKDEIEIEEFIFKVQQSLANVNNSGATEILESIRFKIFEQNNIDYLNLLKLAGFFLLF